MVKEIETKKDKKRRKFKKILVVFGVLLLIGGFGFLIWKMLGKEPKMVVEIKELDNLKDYGYTLTDKDSKYFKAEYEELKKILTTDNVDEEKYAIQVARMFVIDLYSMDTKVNKYDVGGLEYFYVDKKDMYEQKVMDSLYSTMLDDTYGDRKQELPLVKEIETLSVEETDYELGENEVTGYKVQLKITYEKDLGYDDEATLIICKEEGIRWSVVDFQPTLNN